MPTGDAETLSLGNCVGSREKTEDGRTAVSGTGGREVNGGYDQRGLWSPRMPGSFDAPFLANTMEQVYLSMKPLQSAGSASSSRTADVLRVRVLGTFAVEVGERRFPAEVWRSRKAAALVKVLALAPGGRLHREQVLELLWPELDPGSGANNLHYTLHVARRLLAPLPVGHMRLSDQVLSLGPLGAVEVDLWAFERAEEEARRSGDLGDVTRAVELHVGELLPDDPYEEWAGERRVEVHERYVSLLTEMAHLESDRGATAAAVVALQRAIAADPTREEAHARLMEVYASAGQRRQALRQYERLREILERELGAEPTPETSEVYTRVLNSAPSPVLPPTASQPAVRLPAELSSFVGREAESEQISALLGATRLVTLTGPGGAGKTRLALHVARELAGTLREDVRLVELAAADGPSVPDEIAAALGVPEEPGLTSAEAVMRALESRRLLLVLDNCEHVVERCAPFVQALLERCPEVRVLATSREPLGISGESITAIAPLAVPCDGDPVSRVAETEAVRLLTDRIRDRYPSFRVDEENATVVAEICRQLEGLPLALELAAARVGTLSLRQIASRLTDSLALLTSGSRVAGARQRTLRGALDWSFGLLSQPERLLFARLSVFRSGWELSAAVALAGPDGLSEMEVLDLLSRLVERSLVTAKLQPEGEIRYRMLEPTRQYAADLLRAWGEEDELRERHARLYLALAQEARHHLHGPEQAEWIARLEREHDNLRAALQWTSTRDDGDATGLKLVAALWLFWYIRGHLQEGDTWLTAMLARHPGATAARAAALRGRGALAYQQRRYDEAIEYFSDAIAIFQALDDTVGVGACTANLASVLQEHGELDRALALHHEALRLRREAGDEMGAAITLSNIGVLYYMRGEYQEARPMLEGALAQHRRFGDVGSVAIGLNNLGELALRERRFGDAEGLFREGLQIAHQVGETEVIASCMDGLAAGAQHRGQTARAARLYAGADAIRSAIGSPLRPGESEEHERRVHEVHAALGSVRFEEIVRAAREHTPEETVVWALQPAPIAEISSAGRSSELSARERAVAQLVMQGLTNREIARRLDIGERTVETHVRRAMQKLGLSARTQLAAWMAHEEQSATS